MKNIKIILLLTLAMFFIFVRVSSAQDIEPSQLSISIDTSQSGQIPSNYYLSSEMNYFKTK